MNHREHDEQPDDDARAPGMIIVTIGALGTGKTTIQRALSAKLGCLEFELSWMPEFPIRDRERIAYEEDEAIALNAQHPHLGLPNSVLVVPARPRWRSPYRASPSISRLTRSGRVER